MIKYLLLLIFIFTIKQSLLAEPFYIIYTSNINGSMQNCGCGSEPLGGIGRIKTFIDQFHKYHKNVLLVDGGDFFNSYPYTALNESMYQVLLKLDYDILVPGDQEFVEGSKFYKNYLTSFKNELLLTNSNSDTKKRYQWNVDSNQVIFYGYLSPYIFDIIEKPEELKLTAFNEARPTLNNENEFVVVILHGYLSNAQEFARENKWVNLILLAHDQRKGVWQTENGMIVANGKDSEYLSVVTVNYKEKWLITVSQEKISESIEEDDQILSIIEAFNNNK